MNQSDPTTPSHLDGTLLEAVQRQNVFADSKRFVDSVPTTEPADITRLFETERTQPEFDLESFVVEHFELPSQATPSITIDTSVSMEDHIDNLWPHLTDRQTAVNEHDSLISLPNPHVVPGGRFREVYYWDSYFVAEGLAACDRYERIRELVDNFASLIDRFGFIPNGNRTYYLSRSQLPLFCSMVDILVREEGIDAGLPYVSRLEREYEFWMKGAETLSADNPAHRRVVRLDEDHVLNRYWDAEPSPRKESYSEDLRLGTNVPATEREDLYRNIRAACESGWDFSSRWLKESQRLETIRTTEILPIDLNATLYNLERRLGQWFAYQDDTKKAAAYHSAAESRHSAIEMYCWDQSIGFFFDWCWTDGERTNTWSLAPTMMLYFGVCSDSQAAAVADVLRERFLEAGGLLTTLSRTDEQWDAPNGWAPLQWIAIRGLRRYGFDELADEIEARWIALNRVVFRRDRKMIEKYDVTQFTLEGGGGEYPLQDGFGWTNGVVAALSSSPSGETTAIPQSTVTESSPTKR